YAWAAGRVGRRVELYPQPASIAAHPLAQCRAVLADPGREDDGVQPAERSRERAQLAANSVNVEVDRRLRAGRVAFEQRTHVAGNARYAEQARLLVDELLDSACVHLEFVEKVEDHARVQAAAPCAHWQAVDRGEAHRARDAAAIRYRTHAGTVAKMQHDNPAGGGILVVGRQGLGDVLVGQPVESVASYAAVGNRSRECKCLCHLWLGTVECGVEASDLRQLGHASQEGPDRRQVVGLMQRSERNVFLQRREHRRVDANRSAVLESAMDVPMSDSRQGLFAEFRALEGNQMIERAVVAKLNAIAPGLLAQGLPVPILGDETRRGIKAFRLPARSQFETVATRSKERELQAGGARIENSDCIGHVTPPLLCSPRGEPSRPARPPHRTRDASAASPPGSLG